MFSREELKTIFQNALQNFSEDRVPRIAAAFSFYTVLSMAPLLVLAVAIAGRILGEDSVRARVLAEIQTDLGRQSADLVAGMIQQASSPGSSLVAAGISVAVALYAASNLFQQLTDAVYSIWGFVEKGSVIRLFLINRLISTLMVFAFVFALIAWMGLDSWLAWLGERVGGAPGWKGVSFLVTAIFLTLIFGASYRAMPKHLVRWTDVWLGAVIAALGVGLSKYLLSLYFSMSSVSNAYGSAGALVVILLWVYYTSQIYFFGTEITYAYAHCCGSQRGEEHRPPASEATPIIP